MSDDLVNQPLATFEKGVGETWQNSNAKILDRLDEAIATRIAGEDAYQRWPLDLLRDTRARIFLLAMELDRDDLAALQEADK